MKHREHKNKPYKMSEPKRKQICPSNVQELHIFEQTQQLLQPGLTL